EAIALAAALARLAGRGIPVARILRDFQELALGDELEPRPFDLLLHESFFHAMQRLRLGPTGARASTVIHDAVDAAGLEHPEDLRVHLVAVRLHPDGVVIEQDEQ